MINDRKYVKAITAEDQSDLLTQINDHLNDMRWNPLGIDRTSSGFTAWMLFEDSYD